MKLTRAKKKLLKESIILGVLCAVFGGAFYFSMTEEEKRENEYNKAVQKKSSLDRQVAGSKQEHENILKAFEVYNTISPQKLPTPDGIDNIASRIRASRPVIESLKSRYKFASINVTFTSVQPPEIPQGYQHISLVENSMKVQYEAMSDELVFSFIHSLINEFPGYLRLESVNIKRAGEITQEVLNSIGLKKQLTPLVSGEMVFTWKTLKENIELSDKQ